MSKVLKGWQDLGYRATPTLPRNSPDLTAAEVARFMESYGYARQADRWVRMRGRGANDPIPQRVRIVSVLTEESYGARGSMDWFDDFLSSSYGAHAAQSKVVANRETCTNLVNTLLDNDIPRYQSMANVGKALGFLAIADVPAFLRDVVLPAFYGKYPGGRVAVVRTDESAERQAGLLRGLYSLAYTARKDLGDDGFPALREWQDTAGHSMVQLLLESFGYLFYPQVTTYRCGTVGLDFVFIFNEPEVQQLPVFPADWLALLRARSAFGEEDLDGLQAIEDPTGETARAVAHRRYIHSLRPTAEQTAKFLEWWVGRVNSMLVELADPANYTVNRDPDQEIDPIYAFENHLTVSRMIKRIAASLSAAEGSHIKGMIFEIADLLGGLNKRNLKLDEAKHFQKLFHPVDGPAYLCSMLTELPEPFRQYFTALTVATYRDLKTTILGSIWVPNKHQEKTVLVRNQALTGEEAMDENEFVARAIRAYRNGHHGYFTQSDPTKRPSRFLYLLNGNTPDSMSALAAIWLVSFVAAPSEMAGLPTLGLGQHDA